VFQDDALLKQPRRSWAWIEMQQNLRSCVPEHNRQLPHFRSPLGQLDHDPTRSNGLGDPRASNFSATAPSIATIGMPAGLSRRGPCQRGFWRDIRGDRRQKLSPRRRGSRIGVRLVLAREDRSSLHERGRRLTCEEQ
jgi:hypothetical protein